MTDLTDLDPEDVRGHLNPDVKGIDPGSLTVGELRYAARVYLNRQPHQRPLHRDELIAVYEALTDATLEDPPTVAGLRARIAQQLGGVEATSVEAATPLTHDILVALVETLRNDGNSL